jgi:hypothetical protein
MVRFANVARPKKVWNHIHPCSGEQTPSHHAAPMCSIVVASTTEQLQNKIARESSPITLAGAGDLPTGTDTRIQTYSIEELGSLVSYTEGRQMRTLQSFTLYLPRCPTASARKVAQKRASEFCRSDDDIARLEFSDYGRSPRFVSGWWIVPGLLWSGALLVFFVLA